MDNLNLNLLAAMSLILVITTSCSGKNEDVLGGWSIMEDQAHGTEIFFTDNDMMFMVGGISRGKHCVIDEVNLTEANNDISIPSMMHDNYEHAVVGKIKWRGRSKFEYMRYFYPSWNKLLILDGGTFDILSVSDNKLIMRRSQLRAKSNGDVVLEPVDTLTMSRIACSEATCDKGHILKLFSAPPPRGIPIPYRSFLSSPVESTLITISGSGKRTEIKPDECPRQLNFL